MSWTEDWSPETTTALIFKSKHLEKENRTNQLIPGTNISTKHAQMRTVASRHQLLNESFIILHWKFDF